MENILLNALKINDLKLTGASNGTQKTDASDGFESILQGLLGSDQTITRKSQNQAPVTGNPSLKNNLTALENILSKLTTTLAENNGKLDIKALEELLGRTLSEDEISLLQQLAAQKFTLAEIQTALLEDSETSLQALGLMLEENSGESLPAKLETLVTDLDKIISQINLSIENSDTINNLNADGSVRSNEGLDSLLSILESVKGNLQLANNTIALTFTDPEISVLAEYDNIDQVKKTFWATIDRLMGNKSETTAEAAGANLVSSEIISNDDLRDLRKNIENLLQNRQSLQKLFTSDSAADKKFVEAVLNYAEAVKGNKSQAGLTELAKNLSALNTETTKAATVTIGNGLYRELLTATSETTTDESLKTDQSVKTAEMLKSALNEKNGNGTNSQTGNNNSNNPYALNDVQVIKAENAADTKSIPNMKQSNILNQVSEKIHFALNRGQSRVTIQLNPPSLGQVDVSLSIKNNQLQATMIAESVQVKNILESNMGQLRVTLENQNIGVDRISVFVGNDENNFASLLKENRDPNTKNQNAIPFDAPEVLEAAEAPRVIISDKSENLDLFI